MEAAPPSDGHHAADVLHDDVWKAAPHPALRTVDQAEPREHGAQELGAAVVEAHAVARDDDDARIVAGRPDEPRHTGRHRSIDRRQGRAVPRRRRARIPRALRIAEVPELVSATMGLTERAG